MTETEALELLKQARPIFELVEQHGSSKLDENLGYGQYALIENLEQVWFAGWTGPEIEELSRRAGYNSAQLKVISLYFWYKERDANQDKMETTNLWITGVFMVATLIGAFIIAWILGSIFGFSARSVRSSPGEIYMIIGFIVCLPVLGLGYGLGQLVQKYQFWRFKAHHRKAWPAGLYPDNEEGQQDLEK
jgi:hypothetical protein